MGSAAITDAAAQFVGRLQLPFRMNDLRSFLALGLSLPRHRALHVRRQIDVLHLDG
jgi:hypothetical protein